MAFNSDSVQVFLAVLDQGSFSAAARALGRVPSAVSMAVANLEAELDLQLFDRAGREPRPTDAARALEPQARQIALQLRALHAHALSLTMGLEERLTLAIAPELMSARWSGPLAQLAAEYPLLDVEVLVAPQSDALTLLHTGRAQLALVFERPLLMAARVSSRSAPKHWWPWQRPSTRCCRWTHWARPTWPPPGRSPLPAATPGWPTPVCCSRATSGTPTALRPPAACWRPAWAGAGCR